MLGLITDLILPLVPADSSGRGKRWRVGRGCSSLLTDGDGVEVWREREREKRESK